MKILLKNRETFSGIEGNLRGIRRQVIKEEQFSHIQCVKMSDYLVTY